MASRFLSVLCLVTLLILTTYQEGISQPKPPEFYGIYFLIGGRWVEHNKSEQVEADPNVNVLLFDKGIASITAARIHLRRLIFVRNKVMGNPISSQLQRNPNFIQDIKPANEWKWDGRSESVLEIRAKPISGQPEMIQVVPAKPLTPGRYEITYDSAPLLWRFYVQQQKAQTDCFDEYYSDAFMGTMMGMAGEVGELKPCAHLDQLQGKSTGSGSGSSPSQPSPQKYSAAGSEDTRIARLSQNFPDTQKFRELSTVFDLGFDSVWTAVNRALSSTDAKKTQPDRVVRSDQSRGSIITDQNFISTISVGSLVGPSISRQFIIVLEKMGQNSTKVSVKGFCYDYRPNQKTPWSPERCSSWFLEDLEKQIQASSRASNFSIGPPTNEPLTSATSTSPAKDTRVVILAIDGFSPPAELRAFEDWSGYLKKGLAVSASFKRIGAEIEGFPWSGNTNDTKQAAEALATTYIPALVARSERVKVPLVIIAHSWGGILAYQALSKLEEKLKPASISQFVTLGSPFDAQKEGFGLVAGSYAFKYLPKNIIQPKSVAVWVNYWTEKDHVSGKIPQARNTELPGTIGRDHSSYYQNADILEMIASDIAVRVLKSER